MDTTSEWQVLSLSLRAALVGTLIDIPFALGLSWLIVKRRVPGRIVLETLGMLPLALPPVVSGYFLLLLFGNSGLGPALEKLGLQVTFTWLAAALAAGLVSFPLMLRAMMVAMGSVDRRLELAARNLGAGPWRVFATITLPLAYRGVLAGVLLAFVRGLSEFGATIVVAGNIPGRTQTMPLAIYSRLQVGDDAAALRLVLVSVAVAVLSLLAHNYLLARGRRQEDW